MKIYRLFLMLAIIAVIAACGGSDPQQSTDQHPSHKETKQYMCPMKCTGPSASPGKCPKCGMDLEEVTPA